MYGMQEKAIELYTRAGPKKDAARLTAPLALRAGRLEEAIANYRIIGDIETCATLEERSGKTEDAINDWKQLKKYDQAAILAERAGMLHEAAELYQQAGKESDAIRILDMLK